MIGGMSGFDWEADLACGDEEMEGGASGVEQDESDEEDVEDS